MRIYPCMYDGEMQELRVMKITTNTLVMLFSNNRVKLIHMDQ